MSRIRFDQLAKQYLEEFLEPLGTVQRNLEVPGEPKFVDVWFTPAPEEIASVSNLGLLSRIARTPCLLEPFRNAPTRQEVRSCLLKLLWIQEDQRRKMEQEEKNPSESDLSKLWILAATVTRPVIAEFGGQLRRDWVAGVYFAPEGYKTAIIAIDELPLTPETLWLRILGRNNTQQQAIAELLALPIDHPQRSRVLQLLVNWRITLEITGIVDEEERSLMTTLSQAYLEWEQQTEQRGIERGRQEGIERGRQEGIERGRQEGIERGRQEGIEQGEKSLILRQLSRQVGELPEQVRSQIDRLSITQLDLLGEALLEFTNLSDLEAWLAEQ
jgi:hypothetical protein